MKKSFSSNYLLGLLDEDGEKSSNSSLTSTVTDEQLDFLEKPVDMHLKESGSMASEFLYIKVSLNQTKDNIVNDFEAYIEKNHFSIKIADQEKDVKKKKVIKDLKEFCILQYLDLLIRNKVDNIGLTDKDYNDLLGFGAESQRVEKTIKKKADTYLVKENLLNMIRS